jgi:VWFA-related protein
MGAKLSWPRITLLALLVLVVPFGAGLAQGEGEALQVQITQVDTSGFPRVTVYVSVTDAQGEPVGIEPERLILEENGASIRPEELEGSVEAVSALTTLLVIDVSGSMNSAGKLETARAAAKSYVARMRPGDEVGLLSFSTVVRFVQPLTSNADALGAAIDGLRADDDTAMYDALAEAVTILSEIPGRAAIIVLTDGMDNRSEHSLEDVITQIGPAGLSISTIGLGDPTVQDASLVGLDVPALKLLAARAGGEYAYANDAAGLTALYERYARVLQSEYALTYISPGGLRDGVRRTLTVSLADSAAAPQPAAYNPGGLVPEVHAPASWPLFVGTLMLLITLLFLPALARRLFGELRAASWFPKREPPPRIKFKDS